MLCPFFDPKTPRGGGVGAITGSHFTAEETEAQRTVRAQVCQAAQDVPQVFPPRLGASLENAADRDPKVAP